MRVNPANNPAVQGADIKGADSAKKSERLKKTGYEGAAPVEGGASKSANSTAEISTKAKDMAKANQLAKDSPDVRDAKIAELREKIANKKYNVSAAEISDRLVDDHLRLAGA